MKVGSEVGGRPDGRSESSRCARQTPTAADSDLEIQPTRSQQAGLCSVTSGSACSPKCGPGSRGRDDSDVTWSPRTGGRGRRRLDCCDHLELFRRGGPLVAKSVRNEGEFVLTLKLQEFSKTGGRRAPPMASSSCHQPHSCVEVAGPANRVVPGCGRLLALTVEAQTGFVWWFGVWLSLMLWFVCGLNGVVCSFEL